MKSSMKSTSTSQICEKTFSIENEARINDAKMDYFCTKLALASSDKSVRIFSVDCRTGGYHKLAVLTGYDGPVWQLSWSHPKFGPLLATVSFDGRIIIWKEVDDINVHYPSTKSKWNSIFDKRIHESSVNAVSWAESAFGAIVAAGSSDGSISILSKDEHELWNSEVIPKAHKLGCTSVSWSCNSKRFASGGNDYSVKIWSVNDENKWIVETTLQGHTDWVIHVEWSPVAEMLVSTGSDGRIIVWTKTEQFEMPAWNHSVSVNHSLPHINIDVSNSESEDWDFQILQTAVRDSMPCVSWDPMGTFLCVSGDAKEVSLWKQENKEWKQVATRRIAEGGKLSVSFGI